MAGNILATVHIPYTTGLPEDEAVNTFAFAWGGAGLATTEITDLVIDFYRGSPGTNTVSSYLSEVCDRTTNAARVDLAEIVNLGPVPDISPVYFSDSFSLDPVVSGGASWSLPLEVALTASFFNTTDTAVSIRRRRGRIYIGPLVVDAIDTAGPFPLASGGFVGDVALACEALAITSSSNDTNWSVWSRAGESMFTVDTGFVDDEFDTQRRRGADASFRETWTTIV